MSEARKSYAKRSFIIGKFKYIFKIYVTEELIFSSEDLFPLRDKTMITFFRTNSYIETAKQMNISIPELKKKILNTIELLGEVRSFYLTKKLVRHNKKSKDCNLGTYRTKRIRVSEYKKPLVEEFRCNIKRYQNIMGKFLSPLKKDVMELILKNGSYLKTAKRLNITPKKVRNELVGIVKLLKKVKKTDWIIPS